jgi:hypothetical protein
MDHGENEVMSSRMQRIESSLRSPVFSLTCFFLAVAGLFSDIDIRYRLAVAAVALLLLLWCFIPIHRQAAIVKKASTAKDFIFIICVVPVIIVFALSAPPLALSGIVQVLTGKHWNEWIPFPAFGLIVTIAFWGIVIRAHLKRLDARRAKKVPASE